MSLHELLDPNTANQPWKKLYVDSMSVNDLVVNDDTHFIGNVEIINSNPSLSVLNNTLNSNGATINLLGRNDLFRSILEQNSIGNLNIENINSNSNVILKTNGTGDVQLNSNNGFVKLTGSNYTTSNTVPLAINSSNQIVNFGSSGTFVPDLHFGGSSTGIVYLGRDASYFNIGNIVFFSITIVLSSKGSSVGVATISGLPIPAGPTVLNTMNITAANNLTFASSPLVASIQTGSVINLLRIVSGASEVQLDDTNFANNTAFAVSGFYFTN